MAAAGCLPSYEPMSASRPKLMLDEQSFQDMLAAAYTIQEHNTKRRQSLRPEPRCGRCGAEVQEGESLCQSCSAEQFRPGEKLQQKWASMWMKSQEAGVSGVFLAEASPLTNDHPEQATDAVHSDLLLREPARNLAPQKSESESIAEDGLPTVMHSPLPDDLDAVEPSAI